MGTTNRDRRRAKRLKRQREVRARGFAAWQRSGPGTPGRQDRQPPGGRGHRPDEQEVRAAVLAAAEAFRFDSEASCSSRLERLEAVEGEAGPAAIDGAVAWWVDRGLDRAWATGWQPADVVRAVRRMLGPRHADVLATAVAESGERRPEAGADDRWAAQVVALRVDRGERPRGRPWPTLAVAVETVSVLLHLPRLPSLSAPTDRGADRGRGRGGSGAKLEQVRALLAKAESTTFPEEAEALTAKAQELMARHAIDQAMLDAGRQAGPSGVGGWRIGVDEPYAAAKSVLLHHIARANRCRAVWSKELGFSTVFGARSDLEIAELLFTSLLVQGTDAMLRAGRSVDPSGRSRTRSFRQSFLLAYAARIGERLVATAARVVAEGTDRHGQALLPVLASRAEAVEEAVRTAYPHMVERGMAVSNYSGWVAGRAAAELASLKVGEELTAG